jgi:SAM-dependent methyltransferase
MNCRYCDKLLENVFLDLGAAPPSNAYLTNADLDMPESHFPLKLFVCDQCWLVQTEDYARAEELFRPDYAYFSSVSQSWLDHAAQYVEMVCTKFSLDAKSHVIEIASNDGYLLKNFVATDIPCLGIEPTDSTADAAEKLGIQVLREFFNLDIAEHLKSENKQADLIIGNNVFAHVPDINDFSLGLKSLLKPQGVITMEFPHLLRLIEETQFDTVYHEHFSYLSLFTASQIFEQAGLRIWDVEQLPTHGGSLRIYGCHADDSRQPTLALSTLLNEEKQKGLQQLSAYQPFQMQADRVKNNLVNYLIEQKRAGKTVAGYGAAAKGNTLLNYANIKSDLLPYVCDAASSKQGKFLPGSHIPILMPEVLRERQPDIVLILPWNLADEVIAQHEYAREWGGKFVTAIPKLQTISFSSFGKNP